MGSSWKPRAQLGFASGISRVLRSRSCTMRSGENFNRKGRKAVAKHASKNEAFVSGILCYPAVKSYWAGSRRKQRLLYCARGLPLQALSAVPGGIAPVGMQSRGWPGPGDCLRFRTAGISTRSSRNRLQQDRHCQKRRCCANPRARAPLRARAYV